jgi:hypothetical protein
LVKLRPALSLAAYVAFGIAVFAARPPAMPGPLARDFEAYWSAGAAFDRHADPYATSIWNDERTVPGVDARREGPLPFVGPPATLLWWRIAARVPYAAAAPWWVLLLCCALGGLLLVSLRGARATLNAGTGLAAVALAISFGPITSDLALGQYAIVAAFGAGLLVVVRRSLPATIGGVLAFAQPNVVPALISQLSRKRAVIAVTIAGALTYLLGTMAAGWNWIATYAGLLSAHGSAERFSAIQITPAAVAFGFGASPRVALVIAIVVALATIACAIVIAKRTSAFPRFAAFAALTPFVGAFWHEHDLVMAFPAVIWCALRTAPQGRAIALGGTLLVAVDWLGLAQRPGGIVQSALLALAAWCAFNALRSDAVSPAIGYATAIGAVLFAGAAALAVTHPAPVWPPAMHALTLPANASMTHLWAAQQEATGLNRPVAAWAMLRALSLFGCALLAWTIGSRSTCYRTA